MSTCGRLCRSDVYKKSLASRVKVIKKDVSPDSESYWYCFVSRAMRQSIIEASLGTSTWSAYRDDVVGVELLCASPGVLQ